MSVKIFGNMAKLLNWINAEKKIRDCGITIFSPVDLKRIFVISEVSMCLSRVFEEYTYNLLVFFHFIYVARIIQQDCEEKRIV